MSSVPDSRQSDALSVARMCIAAGGAAADMAAAKFSEIERMLMPETAEKRTVEQIVEDMQGGDEATALTIWEIQIGAANFVDQYRDGGGEIDWDAIDYVKLPREFIELLAKVADYEVRL